jgi:uncharacterized membrane protein
MKTVSAIFDTYAEASNAVSRLKQAGIPGRDISLMSNDQTVDRSKYGDYAYNETADDAAGGAGTGAGLGAAAGGAAGLLAGLGLIAIPGIGPLVAAGWVASTLVGAAAGAGAGGIVGALTGAGMSDDESHTYAEGIRRGGSVVSARVNDSDADKARAALQQGSYDIGQRSQSWRSEGWSGRYS